MGIISQFWMLMATVMVSFSVFAAANLGTISFLDYCDEKSNKSPNEEEKKTIDRARTKIALAVGTVALSMYLYVLFLRFR